MSHESFCWWCHQAVLGGESSAPSCTCEAATRALMRRAQDVLAVDGLKTNSWSVGAWGFERQIHIVAKQELCYKPQYVASLVLLEYVERRLLSRHVCGAEGIKVLEFNAALAGIGLAQLGASVTLCTAGHDLCRELAFNASDNLRNNDMGGVKQPQVHVWDDHNLAQLAPILSNCENTGGFDYIIGADVSTQNIFDAIGHLVSLRQLFLDDGRDGYANLRPTRVYFSFETGSKTLKAFRHAAVANNFSFRVRQTMNYGVYMGVTIVELKFMCRPAKPWWLK